MQSRPALLVLLLLAAGCKSAPTWDSGFIEEPGRLAPDARLPFHRSWIDAATRFDTYDEVLVKPVETRFLRPTRGWDDANLAFERKRDVARLARYLEDRLVAEFRRDPRRRLRPVPHQGARTLVLEAALVEVVPTKAAFNAFMKALVNVSFDKATVAMELRLRDGGSGALVAAFADRETGKQSLFSLDDLSWYGHAEAILDDWAGQVVRVVGCGSGEAVQDSAAFTLLPW